MGVRRQFEVGAKQSCSFQSEFKVICGTNCAAGLCQPCQRQANRWRNGLKNGRNLSFGRRDCCQFERHQAILPSFELAKRQMKKEMSSWTGVPADELNADARHPTNAIRGPSQSTGLIGECAESAREALSCRSCAKSCHEIIGRSSALRGLRFRRTGVDQEPRLHGRVVGNLAKTAMFGKRKSHPIEFVHRCDHTVNQQLVLRQPFPHVPSVQIQPVRYRMSNLHASACMPRKHQGIRGLCSVQLPLARTTWRSSQCFDGATFLGAGETGKPACANWALPVADFGSAKCGVPSGCAVVWHSVRSWDRARLRTRRPFPVRSRIVEPTHSSMNGQTALP